ncbi:PLP-dependent transferase [Nocardioides convexus]|uniref:PLP-dependent transferase n=1 Tax=Nocardioides convexus TaxID=2712224 RepID=UPI003100FCBC
MRATSWCARPRCGCTRPRSAASSPPSSGGAAGRLEPATIPEGLVRLSVGIEDVEDLWEDLRQALDRINA